MMLGGSSSSDGTRLTGGDAGLPPMSAGGRGPVNNIEPRSNRGRSSAALDDCEWCEWPSSAALDDAGRLFCDGCDGSTFLRLHS